MRGQVLGVDTRTGQGQVAGDDGRRYAFGPDDWADRGEPRVGTIVDFEAADSRALSLFPIPGQLPAVGGATTPRAAPVGDRNRYVAALLAFFLGMFGVHRFYLGKVGSGLTMLVLTVTMVGAFISVPWALIDTLRYLLMSNREFAEHYE